MATTFIPLADVRRESFDWGVIGWRLVPSSGAQHLVVMDVELEPGQGHDFHRHPGQEEIIIVKAGEVVQYVEQDSRTMGPGDSAFIPEGTVHASFNDGEETAHLQVVISPSLGGETGYGLEDVADQEPWASLRSQAGG
jgi:quercetin dioxygenase-like cupin family protein